MILDNFIVFEGIDGAGTTTQLNMLKDRKEASMFNFSSEPTSGFVGKFLRQVLKGDFELRPETIAYLFAADRNEHIFGKNGVKEHINNGKIEISDRYLFSSIAYQGEACGVDFVLRINEEFPLPKILFFFDIEPDIAFERVLKRNEVKEIYENTEHLKCATKFYKDAVCMFECIQDEMKIVHIDATKPREEIADIIWNEILLLPAFENRKS